MPYGLGIHLIQRDTRNFLYNGDLGVLSEEYLVKDLPLTNAITSALIFITIAGKFCYLLTHRQNIDLGVKLMQILKLLVSSWMLVQPVQIDRLSSVRCSQDG